MEIKLSEIRGCPVFREIQDFRRLFKNEKDKNRVTNALKFANNIHSLCKRDDGSPYISHPLAVARYTYEYGCKTDLIVAALLHDIIEESAINEGDGVWPSSIRSRFGEKVTRMVVNLTKPKLKDGKWYFADNPYFFMFRSQHTPAHYYERSRIYYEHLINSGDVDAILIKLFDNLNNLETLNKVPPEKRIRNAQIIAQHSLLIVTRLFSGDIVEFFKQQLKSIKPDLDIEKYIDVESATYRDDIIELPPRTQITMETFRKLPFPGANQICVYGNAKTAIFTGFLEIGLPEGKDYLAALQNALGDEFVVTKGESLLPIGVAAREAIFRIMGFPQNLGEMRFGTLGGRIVITGKGAIISFDSNAMDNVEIEGDLYARSEAKYKMLIDRLRKFYNEHMCVGKPKYYLEDPTKAPP
ncbi:MAG: HD domain-containing protein [Candidatus Micrarchaeota archaeon]|nr:HD domain-containing protein [Candidatus Micrarchaeota archaeon]